MIMRLRRNRQGEAALPSMTGVVSASAPVDRLNWTEVFGRHAPLYVEIGMGKGDFLMAMAAENPQYNYVGIEKSLTVIHIAAKKYQKSPLTNLRLLPADAQDMQDLFALGQIRRIYLNFSDPWPKKRHEFRRLTAKGKLAMYSRILEPYGQIHIKTDQESFFYFTLRELIREGWSVGKICTDLYHNGYDGAMMTEYERRFIRMGQAIYRLEAWNKPYKHAQDGIREGTAQE